MPELYELLVGIDWAAESHEVCVLNAERRVIDCQKIEHSGTGVAQLAELLVKLSSNQPSRCRGDLKQRTETLVERQFEVYSINLKQMDRSRDRHTVAGAKDDRRDAYVLAESLSTDRLSEMIAAKSTMPSCAAPDISMAALCAVWWTGFWPC